MAMARPEAGPRPQVRPDAAESQHSRRVLIHNVRPSLECGSYPVKRVLGEELRVTADLLIEGHGTKVEAALLFRKKGGPWRHAPMQPAGEDRFVGSCSFDSIGMHEYAVEAWPEGSPSNAARSPELEVFVDRPRALAGAWYEMFHRSQGRVPGRSATFADCVQRLPEIARLGFDVVYLPPIHPIGRVNRKGRDNQVKASPGDPGSPWAIGSAQGGHRSVHPDLGTPADFRNFVREARRLGLEIALDLALQCAPDHPFISRHPRWFKWKPDGTIQYAENPPKKYEDIVPFDFDTEDWRALWDEWRDTVLFWVGEGVTIFRVDNPHTKPVAFWQWLIAEVQREHPDVIFLSEAFTRPALMTALAKAGFTQSYTYFTWRSSKRELGEYMHELTSSEMSDYFRPNFFTNTPDILPGHLQTGGRPAFKQRLVLAATLSPSYGIYNGFELCEAAAVPGSEDYLHSEKYEYKVWDWERPGNIKDFVAKVNRVRREHPAFSKLKNLRFLQADSEDILFYEKTSPGETLLIAVNLDPHWTHDSFVHVPIAEYGIDPSEPYVVEDLLTGARYEWRGAVNYVRLDPNVEPAHIFKLSRVGR
jgi:starch synthase (maltosyl-transferring)